MMRARAISSIFISAAIVSTVAAQEYSYQYGHLSRVDGEATLQRACEPEPEAGAPNVPVMPGDRLWTPSRSRAEVAFADGTRVRIDERTKLDFVEIDSELIVRLWSGSLILRLDEPRVAVRIDTPSGTVFPSGQGLYRIDLDGDRLVLSVLRGAADLATAAETVEVRPGETSESVAGAATRPYAFNTARLDDFDAWSESLDATLGGSHEVIVRSLPREVHHYAHELDRHGAWYSEPDYGYVWYPSVGVSWSPYREGRWQYTRFGYTWISYEPWGWAPYHYGRWGYGHRGWYWIPGDRWGPAWVSFAFGPSWVGWSPLGYHGRSVFGFDSVFHSGRRYRGGHAVPRRVYDDGAGWNFVGQQQFTAGSGRARLRASQVSASAPRARLYDAGAVLDRDLRPRSRASVRAASRPGSAGAGASRLEPTYERRRSGDSAVSRSRSSVSSGSRSGSSSSSSSSPPSTLRVRERNGNEDRGRNDGVAPRRTTPTSDAWRERGSSTSRATERTRPSSRAGAGGSGVSSPERRSGTENEPRSTERGSAWRERSSGSGSSGVERRPPVIRSRPTPSEGQRSGTRSSPPAGARSRSRSGSGSGSEAGASSGMTRQTPRARPSSPGATPSVRSPASGGRSGGAVSNGGGAGASSRGRSGAARARRKKN